jgi:hypothetical protein
MPGFAHIFRLGEGTGTYGRTVEQYQLNYTIGGNTYARVFDDEAGLDRFLRSELALTPEMADKTMRELRELGRATIANVEITAQEAPALGLQQVPSDY